MGNQCFNQFVYAVSVNNSDKKENETHIFRHPDAVHKDIFSCETVKTLQEVLEHRFKKLNELYLGYRLVDSATQERNSFFTWKTNGEVKDIATKFGSGLLELGLVPRKNSFKHYELSLLGFYSKNTVEYFIADLACILYDVTSVPIYDTLGEEAMIFSFNQTKMTTCIVLSSHLMTLITLKKAGKLPFLENVIVSDQGKIDAKLIKESGESTQLFTFEEVVAAGAASLKPYAAVKPESIYVLSYTSGTTGEPKGAMISHKNVVCLIPSVGKSLHSFLAPGKRYLSYLPMAHILERAIFHIITFFDFHIGIFSGDVNKLSEDAMILKPTLFVSVPRVYVKMYQGIIKQVKEQSWLKEALFNHALNVKLRNLHQNSQITHSLYDRIVFNKVRGKLGGAVELMITGSAAIKPEVLNFLRVAFSARIIEGYGQTEGCGIQFISDTEDTIGCGVGGPQIQNEFKLVDVPELGYFSTDCDENNIARPRGEIWMRGPNVIRDYYFNEEKFKEICTVDGWLKTGDIGMIEGSSMYLKIIDRKKNIFKLSQGEYIAPDKLENIYKTASPFISDVFVYGDAYREKVVAVVVMEWVDLIKFAAERKVNIDLNDSANESPELKKKVLDLFYVYGKENKLNSLEIIKAVHIITTSFVDLGLKTATFKLKRHDARTFFASEIEKLYQE